MSVSELIIAILCGIAGGILAELTIRIFRSKGGKQ